MNSKIVEQCKGTTKKHRQCRNFTPNGYCHLHWYMNPDREQRNEYIAMKVKEAGLQEPVEKPKPLQAVRKSGRVTKPPSALPAGSVVGV